MHVLIMGAQALALCASIQSSSDISISFHLLLAAGEAAGCMHGPAGTSITHALAALSCRAENWEKNGNKTASADQKLHLMGAGLCSELSCEFGSWRQWEDQGGGKGRGGSSCSTWLVWNLGFGFAVVPILVWPGVCHQSELRVALLTSYIVSLWEVLPVCHST